MQFFDNPDRLAKNAGQQLLQDSLTPAERELVQSINPDQMVIEGLASEFDPYHGVLEPIPVTDEAAIELAVQSLEHRVTKPDEVELEEGEIMQVFVEPEWLFNTLAGLALEKVVEYPDRQNFVWVRFTIEVGND